MEREEDNMLPDIQSIKGDYKFAVLAGIEKLRVPLLVKTRGSDLLCTTEGEVSMSVLLPADQKGIHMSRLPIIVNNLNSRKWVLDNLEGVLDEMLTSLESTEASIVIKFRYFYNKLAPVSGFSGIAHCTCYFKAIKERGQYQFVLSVEVPVITLCPCSKEISEVSAHNQRAFITMDIEYGDSFIWIEELIEIAEKSASCAVYPVLKRTDEKFVTEKMYNNAKFVEDVARECASLLEADTRIRIFNVEVRSEESIHQHDAVARIEGRSI